MNTVAAICCGPHPYWLAAIVALLTVIAVLLAVIAVLLWLLLKAVHWKNNTDTPYWAQLMKLLNPNQK